LLLRPPTRSLRIRWMGKPAARLLFAQEVNAAFCAPASGFAGLQSSIWRPHAFRAEKPRGARTAPEFWGARLWQAWWARPASKNDQLDDKRLEKSRDPACISRTAMDASASSMKKKPVYNPPSARRSADAIHPRRKNMATATQLPSGAGRLAAAEQANTRPLGLVSPRPTRVFPRTGKTDRSSRAGSEMLSRRDRGASPAFSGIRSKPASQQQIGRRSGADEAPR